MAIRKTAARKLALSVPAETYEKLERIARARRSEPGAVAAALLHRGLGGASFEPGLGKEHVEAWKRAFTPLTEDEMLAVDGILMGDAEPQ